MVRAVNTIEVLEYVKSVFDSDAVLDSVPASAVGNMSAWRAWGARDKSEIWAERVAAAVTGSRSDGMLYTAGEGDEPVSFFYSLFNTTLYLSFPILLVPGELLIGSRFGFWRFQRAESLLSKVCKREDEICSSFLSNRLYSRC